MKKNRFLIKYFIILSALLFVSQSTILADKNNSIDSEIINSYNHYYKPSGLTQTSILYVGGYGDNNYSKIQDAIDDANDGDTIFVYGSSKPYYEHIFIHSSITLIGENKNTTIIDGSQYESVIQINSSSVFIKGFTIQNSGYDFFSEWDAGIVCKNVDSCDIFDNILINNYIGIYVLSSSNISIKNTTIFSNNTASDGIICKFSSRIFIINNIFGLDSNTQRDAIYLSQVTNSEVTSNYIFNYQNGLRLFRSHQNTIQKNWFISNQMFGIQIQNSGNNAIQTNTISDSFYGIIISYVPPSTDNKIIGNDFIDNINHAFFIELQSGKTKWYHNFWDGPYIFPKPILGFSRDTKKIQDEETQPVLAFDFRPNNKPNNNYDYNLPFVSYIQIINRVSKSYWTSLLFPLQLFKSKTIIKQSRTSIDLKKNDTPNIRQSNVSINDVYMRIGDIIFMECKRYNPAHSRPTHYSDHVALYIGNDPITNEKMFVDTVDGFGPRICNFSDFERWAHHFALGRVIRATEKQRIGAVTWVKQLCLERNKPYNSKGDLVFDNYQYLPEDFDVLGCSKSYLLDSIEKFTQFWYCSELVWAAYYNVDDQGNLDLFQENSQRIDLDPSGWNFPFVVTAYEILIDDDVEIYYKEPLT